MKTLLIVDHVSAGYRKKQVLFDVSLELSYGEIVLLAGNNGSGKSTLLKAICGLPSVWTIGNMAFEGEAIYPASTARMLKKGLLYVPQRDSVFYDLTVRDNLEIAALRLGPRRLRKYRIEKVLATFPLLVSHLGRLPMKMSGGERQLLSIAMSALHEPKLLLIDEPFNALSPQNTEAIASSIRALNQSLSTTVLIAEHRLAESLKIADRVLGLKAGRIISEYSGHLTANVHTFAELYV